MKRNVKQLLAVFSISLLLILSGCTSVVTKGSGVEGQYIIDAKQAATMLGQEGTVLVDMQAPEEYENGHIKGAVNISLNDIVINIPVPNMLASKGKVEETLSKNGISNDSMIVIYDNKNNMEAARLWWTLKVYGHENMKVVSGGLNALKAEGIEITTEAPVTTRAKYVAKDKNNDMIATLDDVKNQVTNPDSNVILLDTRSLEEFNEGTIPGSILLDYTENNFKDGTYKPIDHIKIQYIEKGITPDKNIIMYCKTSIRGAQTYLALYNAGYTNLKLYDGAWVEWSANPSLPIEGQAPSEDKIEPNQHDNS